MDRHFLVLVFATVISTVYTIEEPPVNPLQSLDSGFNPGLFGASSFGFNNGMMMHPSRRAFSDPFGHGFPPSMYMGVHPPFPAAIPPTIAYWLSKFSIPPHPPVPGPVPVPAPVPNEHQPPVKTSDTPTLPTTTTPSTPPPTTIAATTEAVPEITTIQVVEIQTTEAPKQQTEEPTGEDPKQRQLPTHPIPNGCGPNEEVTEVPTTVVNVVQPVVTTIAPAPVVTAPAAAAVTTDEVATLRRNDMSALSETGLPPSIYPGKSLYDPSAFSPMSYLAAMSSLDPYAAYRRMGVPPMFPRIPGRFFGF